METLIGALWLVGVATMVMGYAWVLGVALSEGVGWGMACMVIPIAPVLLVLSRPAESRKAIAVYGIGIAMTVGAQILSS